jgi:4-hydroxy-tetrahydrodipicolinate synthase
MPDVSGSSSLASAAALPLAGVLPVAQLPYRDDESIDFEALEVELDWLLRQGAHGVVMAMVTETLRLTAGERKDVAATLCQAMRNRGPAIISVGAESTFAAIDFALHAESAGATALMVIPPISVAPLHAELVRYFRRIIEAVNLPVIVQDASAYVGRPIGIESMRLLLDEFGPHRVLFKPEASPLGPQLSALRDVTGGRARVFEGSGGIALLDNHRRGIVGTMPGADLIVGVVALWKALERGDDAAAYRISLPLSSLVSLQTGLDGFLAIEKHLLARQGVFRNTIVRGPVGYVLDDETRAEVDRLFDLLTQACADEAAARSVRPTVETP